MEVSGRINYFLNMETDNLYEVMNYLSLRDAQALSCTSIKLNQLAETVISVKNQAILEKLTERLLKRYSAESITEIEGYQYLKEIAQTLPNGSREKCQAIRDMICSFFALEKMDSIYPKLTSSPIFDDRLLVIQLMKAKKDTDKVEINCVCRSENDLKVLDLYLGLLGTNQLFQKKVELNFIGFPLDYQNLLRKLSKAITENKSMNEIALTVNHWNLDFFYEVLEAIKNNERIKKINIMELEYDFGYFLSDEVKRTRGEHIQKLDKIVRTVFEDLNQISQYSSTWKISR